MAYSNLEEKYVINQTSAMELCTYEHYKLIDKK